MESAPHGKLFPKCSVVVHHGGVGTFGASVRSGRPTVICPITFDQFPHSDLVNKLGVGVGMKAMKTSTPQDLAEAIQKCSESKDIHMAAQKTAEKLRQENGLANLIQELSDYYKEEIATGRHRATAKQRLTQMRPKRGLAALFGCLRRQK